MRQLFLFALVFAALPATALTSVELYETEVALRESANADEQARIEGMKKVMIKASGVREAISHPLIKKALERSDDYLAHFSYDQKNGVKTLKMGFSDEQVRALLTQAELPFWPESRTSVLVWLVQEAAEREIVWEHSNSTVLKAIREAADSRGLPITVPIGDFADVTGVSVSDLWGGFAKSVGQASQRYPVDAVLIVKGEGDQLRWTLYDQKPSEIGTSRQEIVSGSSVGADSASNMINEVSDYFAEKNAVKVASRSSSSVKARFSELNNPISLFIIENKIRQLSSVASVDVLNLQGTQVMLDIHLLSSQKEFEQELLRNVPVRRLMIESESNPVVDDVVSAISEPDLNASSAVSTATSAEEKTQPESTQSPQAIQSTETLLQFEWQEPVAEEQPAEKTENAEQLLEQGTQPSDV